MTRAPQSSPFQISGGGGYPEPDGQTKEILVSNLGYQKRSKICPKNINTINKPKNHKSLEYLKYKENFFVSHDNKLNNKINFSRYTFLKCSIFENLKKKSQRGLKNKIDAKTAKII